MSEPDTSENDSFAWTDNLVENLIVELQKHRCLWDTATSDYKNNTLRKFAVKSISKTLVIR